MLRETEKELIRIHQELMFLYEDSKSGTGDTPTTKKLQELFLRVGEILEKEKGE